VSGRIEKGQSGNFAYERIKKLPAQAAGGPLCLPYKGNPFERDILRPNALDSERNLSFRLTWKTTMPNPRINGVVETCLCSDDLPRSVHFYREQLGLRLLESGERLCAFSVADKQVLLIFRSGGTMEPVPTPGGMIPPHGATGQLHFTFAVSIGDFAAWEQHLLSHGITIESKVSWPKGGQSIYFRDPDNHLVELATPGIWEVY